PTMELLPLVLVPLAANLATGIEDVALDMAPDSFDDQYQGCRSEMLKALPKLNSTEFSSNSVYATAWAKAAASWNKPLGSLQRWEQAIALRAYSMNTELYKEFNAAVRTAGRARQEYLDKFTFKVVHFLLTEALDDLWDAQTHPRCLHVYRGVRGIRFTAKPGDIVRFGQFTSTSLNQTVAKRFGTDTFFELHTCHGAAIWDFSFYPRQQEVLVPPFETFNVTSVTRQGDKIHIQLRPHGMHSNYNCAYSSGDIPG
ncbi:NRT2 ribosyltransferase, partial [Cephalopterus ornatus]|nr:NRT2 ribosyltransferase [Cephalopterus ornatus]